MRSYQNERIFKYNERIDNLERLEWVTKMKTITLTDEELKKLKGLFNVASSGCLDDSIIAPFEDLRKEAIKQANEYKKLYNKIIKPEYTEE